MGSPSGACRTGWRVISGCAPVRPASAPGVVSTAHLEDQETYLPWVVEEFSGLLCVDEVYQGQLALRVRLVEQRVGGDGRIMVRS